MTRDPSRFVAELSKALAPKRVEFMAGDATLTVEGRLQVFLDRAVEEYESAGFLGRKQVVRRWAASIGEGLAGSEASTFAAVRDLLAPYLLGAGFHARLGSSIAAAAVTSSLMQAVAVDRGETRAPVSSQQLIGWGVSLEQATAVAARNLVAR
jgi:hypothetical protein